MSAAPRYVSVELEEMTCGSCGILFAAPRAFFDERRRGGSDHSKGWHCPNGHARIFSDDEATKLKRELDATKRDLEFQKAQRAAAEEEARRTERQNRRLKRRISDGVCPCCHRTFLNIQRHMKTKHPEFANTEG